MILALLYVLMVSEELNSVETFHLKQHGLTVEEFQKNLVVWKLALQKLQCSALYSFQKNLVVWKPALVGAITVIPMLFQKDLIVWKL